MFSARQAPEEMPRIVLRTRTAADLQTPRGDILELEQMHWTNPLADSEKWPKVLVQLKQVASRAEADRLFKQNAVEINGNPITDISLEIRFDQPGAYVVRIGKKKFFRLIVEQPLI